MIIDDNEEQPARRRDIKGSIRRFGTLAVAVFIIGSMLMQPPRKPRPAKPKAEATEQKTEQTQESSALETLAPEPVKEKQPAKETREEEKPAEKAADDASEKTAEKKPEEPTAETAEKHAEKPAEKPDASAARIAQLEMQLMQQEALIDMVAGEVARLNGARSELQHLMLQQQNQLASLTLLGQLRQAVTQGDAFRPLVDQLRELNHNNPRANTILVALSGASASGIDTLATLQRLFATPLEETLRQSAGGGFSAKLQTLVRIRKVGEQQQGMDDEAILARAEAQLEQGQLEETLKTLEALSAPGKHIFTAWNKRARDYISAHKALNELQAALLQTTPHTAPEPAEAPAAPPPPSQPASPEATE